MLLYTSKLREGETPLGSTERDKTSRSRDGGKGQVLGSGGWTQGGRHLLQTGTTTGSTAWAGTSPGKYE